MRRPWDKYRAEMVRLYIDEGKKLDDVMKIMFDDFNFRASKRAYRFHFDHWGIEKYNCKKRNQRKIKRQQHLPSPPITSSPTHSASVPTVNIKDEQCSGGLDLSQDNSEYFADTFMAQSLPQSTGLAFSSTNLPYPGGLVLSPMQPLVPSPTRMTQRPPPSPEPDVHHLSFGHDLNHLGPRNSYLCTPLEALLQESIRQRNEPQVRTIIAQGSRLDLPDANGSYPAHTAARCGEPRILQMILHAGGDPNQPDRLGQSPLYQASTLPVLDVLLGWNPPPNLGQKDLVGDTILHYYLRNMSWYSDPFRREVVHRLLDQRTLVGTSPVNVANARGLTPFHLVLAQAGTNLPALMEPLTRMLARNADVSTPVPDPRYRTPRLPLCVLVESLQAYLQSRGNPRDALDESQCNMLQGLLLRFLDLSIRGVYPARLLRVFLSPMLLPFSVCRLWNFLQRFVLEGVGDASLADKHGRTALHDVLLNGCVFVNESGHAAGEERVTFLVRVLARGMTAEKLRLGDGAGQAAWQIYARLWSGHRRFGEMMGMFAETGADIPGFTGGQQQQQQQQQAPRMMGKAGGESWEMFPKGQAQTQAPTTVWGREGCAHTATRWSSDGRYHEETRVTKQEFSASGGI